MIVLEVYITTVGFVELRGRDVFAQVVVEDHLFAGYGVDEGGDELEEGVDEPGDCVSESISQDPDIRRL